MKSQIKLDAFWKRTARRGTVKFDRPAKFGQMKGASIEVA